MRKPKNTTGLFAFIMMALGVVYLVLGAVVMCNEVYTSGDEGAGAQLVIIGILFLIVGLFVAAYLKARNNSLKDLEQSGDKVSASVVSAEMQKHMHWGMFSPYVVKYTFEYCGKTYNAQSDFIWEVPTCYQNDVITVLVDKKKPQISKPMGITESEG
ncbi:MAG: DUF3592 domain-containing protein [Bacillota bacterium]